MSAESNATTGDDIRCELMLLSPCNYPAGIGVGADPHPCDGPYPGEVW